MTTPSIHIPNTREAVDRLVMRHKQAELKLHECEQSLQEVKEEQENNLKARAIVQEISAAVQQKVHDKIAGIVEKCLATVFEDAYEFQIRWDCKRGKTEAVLMFVRDGIELDDPLNQVGGGVIDVAALALRLASILLCNPKRRKLLVLDEPLKNVRGKENRRRVRNLLQSLADDMGMQIILNVDIDSYPEFSLGKLVEISK
jgi:DNA repair exonuclease SbcCD ATPase subunit